MTSLEEEARWVLDVRVAATQVDMVSANGATEIPTVVVALKSMAPGATLRDLAFTAAADDRFVFTLAVPAAQVLVSEVLAALKELQQPT